MKITESKQYESQGWSHIHIWKIDNGPLNTLHLYGIYRCICHCGAVMIQRGEFKHIIP